ncbi:TPA: hypothetical protein ON598_000536 [Enterococcus faecalis]|uniref:hypothetical protein n=1 Tax=Enterococcus faecalis TaxID=1351 RepID=UPI00042058AF|nr:hypothetical protein [Enterococcus faecalis]HCR3485253.1 hypothetical protein [Enterococcus faecalis]HCR4108577.1 hypothetical protein [Enterococcus faecalis]
MKKDKKRLVLTSVITLILVNIIDFFKNARRYVFRNLFSNIFGRKSPFIGIGIAPNQ